MTPSITFQCPLSPAGTFQPERSLPLKRGVNPAGSSLSAAKRVMPAATVSQAAAMSIQPLRYIEKPPPGEMRNDRPPRYKIRKGIAKMEISLRACPHGVE